ncbi:unnamed protein product [Coccothraustes coccothraustes]
MVDGAFLSNHAGAAPAVAHPHRPSWDPGPLHTHTLYTARQGFLTGSSLRFPQQSPRCLDPYKNLIVARQHNYQLELVPAGARQKISRAFTLTVCARRQSGVFQQSHQHLLCLSVPTWATRPRALCCAKSPHFTGPCPGLSPHRAQPSRQLLTELPALNVPLQHRAMLGNWRPFTSRPQDLTQSSCTSAFNTALGQVEPDYVKDLKRPSQKKGSWKRLLQQSRCRSESGSRAQPVPVNHRGYGLRLEIAARSAAAEGFRVPMQQNWKPQLPSPPAQRVLSVCREKSGLAAGELGLGVWEGLCSRESEELQISPSGMRRRIELIAQAPLAC